MINDITNFDKEIISGTHSFVPFDIQVEISIGNDAQQASVRLVPLDKDAQ